MKISEIGTVVQHPAVQAEAEFVNLLQSNDIDEVTAFIMDDRNAKARRLYMLRHLDELVGDVHDSYTEDDLEEFMWGQDEISPEEADEIARDLGFPPYHLKPVEEETFSSDADIPTGEYEICTRCFGDGCDECEGGLNDVTGRFEVPDFD
jgi:hypothetical protein